MNTRIETISTPLQSTDRFTFDLQRFDNPSLSRDDSGAFLIGSTEDLDTLSAYTNAGNSCSGMTFKLTQDITYSYTDDTTSNFTPIADNFKGTFDGQEHTISGLRIQNATASWHGLFREVTSFGTVKNLTLNDAKISGNLAVGGIVGWNNGTVENCHVTSSVTITATKNGSKVPSSVGGVVGNHNKGTIKNCSSAATVNTSTEGTNFGGVVGYNNNSTVQDCIAINANVSNGNYAGIGAVVGCGPASNSIVINTTVNGTVENSYVILTLPAGVTVVNGGISYDGKLYAGKNATVTLSVDSSEDYLIVSSIGGAGKNSDGTFTYTTGDTDATLELDGLHKVDGLTYNAADDSYEISSAAALQELADFVNAGNNCAGLTFKLTGDITFTHSDDWDNVNSTESNFTAIGDETHAFLGTFDGQGHTISGIRIYKSGNTNADGWQGLFGNIGTYKNYEGKVKNVTLSDTRITGWQDVGGIVGYNFGIVENCHVTDTVAIHAVQKLSAYHGGIAGDNRPVSTIKDCTSSTTITTSASGCIGYGGIVGLNSGTLENCLALNANVTGSSNVGAIIGSKSDGTYTNNLYFNCTVTNKTNSNVTTNIGVGDENNNSSDITGAEIACGIDLPEGVNVDSGILYGGKLYAISGATVNIWAKTGYKITNINATLNDDQTSYNFTATDGLNLGVTLETIDGIFYVDGNGVEQVIETGNYNLLVNGGSISSSGWYVVRGNVTLGDTGFDSNSEVNLILCDGATLNTGSLISSNNTLTLNIYGQSGGTGTLNAAFAGVCLRCNNLNIYGGKANFEATDQVNACVFLQGTMNVNGGEVSFTNEAGNACLNTNSHPTLNVNGDKLTVTNKNMIGDAILSRYTMNLNGGIVSVSNNPINCPINIGEGCKLIGEDGTVYTHGTSSDTLKTVLRGHTVTTLDATNHLITVPEGVTVTGDNVNQISGKYFSTTGNVTLTIGNGAALGNVTGIDNVAANSRGKVTFNVASDVTITDENIFYAVTVNGATISGNSISVDGTDYYNGNVTVTAKTGYVVDSSTVTVNEDTTISATFDTANHYVLANDTSTLATESNTATYPELVQVYELTLPDNVIASGDTVVTDGGKTYAAGSVTLSAADGYTLKNVTVNGTPDDDGVFTINGDTNITADVTAIVEENNIFNAAGTGVTVNGKRGDFHANSTLYSITASQQNSTLVANAKNNTVIISGGGENILTGGTGNDTFKFSAGGGGIVTDYGIGATKDGSGKAVTANGVDVVKVNGKVTGIYFERDASTKKDSTFTATIVYGDDNQIIVLKDIVKKPTKTGSSPIYQTNDVAAATLKIWDTSSGTQKVLSAAKLKKLFHDDSCDAFTGILKDKTDYLVDVSKGLTPATNPFEPQIVLNSNKPKN